jgi:pimeloyl-ACP methyl ester carboxylesterase
MRSLHVDVAPAGAQPVRLRVRHWPGSPTGAAPFVLVHGLSSNAMLWDEVATVLADAGHEVAAIDLRSHGESDAPPDGYDTTTAAQDVAAVCASLRLPQVVAVGQSWGGNVVVRIAARHPDLIAAVGLVDGGWLDMTTMFASWPACAAALRPADVDGLPAEQLRTRIAADHPGWSPTAVAATVANLRELPDGTLVRRLSIEHHMQIVRSMWDAPPWDDLARIQVPVLLMPALPATDGGQRRAGRGDKRELVARAAAALPKAEVREYVGGDHDLHAQQPAAVAADLLALAARA